MWFNNYLYVVLKWIIFIKKSEIWLLWFLSLWLLCVCLCVCVCVCVCARAQSLNIQIQHYHVRYTTSSVCSLRFQHCTLVTASPSATLCVAWVCFCWKAVVDYWHQIHLQCRKYSGCCRSHQITDHWDQAQMWQSAPFSMLNWVSSVSFSFISQPLF